MPQGAYHPTIDPLTGCCRKDIQTEWRALIIASDGSTRDCLTFYLHPDLGERAARNRAVDIWMPARNWPHSLLIEKVRGPLAAWPSDSEAAAAPALAMAAR